MPAFLTLTAPPEMISLRNISDRTLFMALAIGTLTIDAGGLGLQNFLKLAPCPLCIFQRVLFLLLTCLALIGVFRPPGKSSRLIGALILLVSLGGAITAGYQSWMQAFPEKFTAACSYTDPNLIEQFVDWLGMLYPPLFMATGLCTSKAWDLFGLSMANWAFLTFSAIVLVSAWRLRQR